MTDILKKQPYFKPFSYPDFWDIYMLHEQCNWTPEEISLTQDVVDWKNVLDDDDRALLTNIFRFFVQGDLDIGRGYLDKLIPSIKNTEARAMLSSFALREFVHIRGYSYLITTLGIPDLIYKEFLQYQEMVDKHEFLFREHSKNLSKPQRFLLDLAVFSVAGEGIQLYSSFIMLLAYPRVGLLKDMGQLIKLSVKDEAIHVMGNACLFDKIVQHKPDEYTAEVKELIVDSCKKMVELEIDFIKLCTKVATPKGLTVDDLIEAIKYLCDLRLGMIGLTPVYNAKNTVPWFFELILSVDFNNFFERRGTEYTTNVSQEGAWAEVISKGLFDSGTINRLYGG
jgi:ribonucleoside-diphosphate reductase beta chain